MNFLSLALRVRSRFQASLVFFLGNSHRPDTVTLEPFTQSSYLRVDFYVNANMRETQLISDAQLTFPSLTFNLTTWMDLGRQSPDPPGHLILKIRPLLRRPIVTVSLNSSKVNSDLDSSPLALLRFTKSL
jgi:hypothetical protein